MTVRILTLYSLICLLGGTSLWAEPTVFFRGKELSHRHYVYGEVVAATQLYGSVNLGYAHGIQVEQRVGVLRRIEGKLVPIGILRITRVRAGDSLGEYEGPLTPRKEDIAILAARDLNLWKGQTRSDLLVSRSLLDQNSRGYDTGDLSLSLLKEVGRDDDLIARRPEPLHVNLDEYSMRYPKRIVPVTRGAFRPGNGMEDGPANSLSAADRKLASDQPTLDLETALAQYVTTSPTGKLIVSTETLRELANDRTSVIEFDQMRDDIDRENRRVHQVLKP